MFWLNVGSQLPQAPPVKRSELLLVSTAVACVLLLLIGLVARRYSAVASLIATMKVEQHSFGVDTAGWVMVDGVRHPFTASGPTNFTVNGRLLRFEIEKVAGTNHLDVTMTGSSASHRPPRPPVVVGGWVTCPDQLSAGLRVWQKNPRQDERLHWRF